jgi:hypothetical protein
MPIPACGAMPHGQAAKVAMTQPAPTPPTPGDPAPPAPPTPPTPPPAPGDPAPDDRPLGPAGEKALATERAARKALEQQVADLAPLRKLAEALGAGTPAAGGKTEAELLTERLAAHERELGAERQARWRAEVAAEKNLTAAQAARLVGATRDELAADADALVSLFPPPATPAGPRTPAPDPSQGAQGTGATPNLDAQIAEATKAGNVREAIRLKQIKLHQAK